MLLALLRMSEGTFVVRAEVRDGEGAMVKHFYGIDAWCRVIYDNDEDRSKAYCVWRQVHGGLMSQGAFF